jgi:hypothetical protein
MLDSAPLGPQITGPNMLLDDPFSLPYSWDTTGTADGTHVLWALIIDSNAPIYGGFHSSGTNVIVQNSGPINLNPAVG